MRKTLRFVAILGILTIGFLIAYRSTVTWIAEAAVIATPFTLEMEIADVSTPQRNVFTRKVLARKSNGTTVEWSQKKAGTLRRILTMDGKKILVSDLIQAKTERQSDAKDTAALKTRLMNPPEDCRLRPGMKLKGHTSIRGVKVAILESQATPTTPAPTHGRKITWYMAPELGCEMLRYTVARNGKVLTEGKLIGFTKGEPAAALFAEGVGFKSLKPSAFITEQLVRMGAPDPKLSAQQANELDTE